MTGPAVRRQCCSRSGHRWCRLPCLRKPPRRGAGRHLAGAQPPVPRGPHAMTLPDGNRSWPDHETRQGPACGGQEADCDRRGARPMSIGGLVDCRSHRRRESGTGLWHLRYMRSGYIPRERENYPYQHGADCRGEPRPTAGAGEPSWSRLSTAPESRPPNRIVIPRWMAILLALFVCLIVIPLAHGAVPWEVSKLTHRHGWVNGSPGFWNLLGLIPVGVATALLIWTLITGIAHAPNTVRLGLVPSVLTHRRTLSIYAESDVCRGTSIVAGVGGVVWEPERFSGMYRTAASCESRNCALGRTDFGSSIRSGLSYVQETGAPLVGTSQQPEIGAVMARSARHVLWIAGGCEARSDAYSLAQPQVTYPVENFGRSRRYRSS